MKRVICGTGRKSGYSFRSSVAGGHYLLPAGRWPNRPGSAAFRPCPVDQEITPAGFLKPGSCYSASWLLSSALYNYRGNIHVHSLYSDGSGSIGEIAADAAAAGLDYVIIADHQTLDGLPEESIRHGVTVIVGVEINRPHSHYLALGIKENILPHHEDPQQVIDQVNEAGGFGFIAHPFEKGSRYLEKGKAYPWKIWPVFGFQGFEIWNYTSHWRGRHPSLLKTLYWFLFDRKGAMDGPPRETLQLWDCYNVHRGRTVGIGSSDAHAFPYNLGLFRVKVFTYRYAFTTINTYVVLEQPLSRDFEPAKKQILEALRIGSCYFSFDSLHQAGDFRCYAAAAQRAVKMGGEVALEEKPALHVKAPSQRAQVRIIHNGRLIKKADAPELVFPLPGPGVYRAEVYFRPRLKEARPWIYANPVFVR